MKLSWVAFALMGLASSATALAVDEIALRIGALFTGVASVVTPFVLHRYTDRRLERESRERREEADRAALLKAAAIKADQDRFEVLVRFGLLNTENAALEAVEKARRTEDLLQELARMQREIERNTAINSTVIDPIVRQYREMGIDLPPVPPRAAGSSGSGYDLATSADPPPPATARSIADDTVALDKSVQEYAEAQAARAAAKGPPASRSPGAS